MSKLRDSSTKTTAVNPAADSNVDQLSADHLTAKLVNLLKQYVKPHRRLVVAFSGGLDSSVLLHMLSEQKASFGFMLEAVHVHHGLSPNADDWASFCQQTCKALDIPIKVVRVDVAKDSGVGTEAAARHARYLALSQSDADLIVLAHHQDDQAETLIIQLLRGSGVKGLAAMPIIDSERRLFRPLLDISRAELQRYATAHHLAWIEDESNQDQRHDRNFLRHALIPVIERRFKSAKKVLARTAGHMAESAELMDDLASIDAACTGLSERDIKQRLPLACLQQLRLPRARNLLRWWLALNELDMPSTARLEEMLSQLLSARADAVIGVKINADTQLRRYQNEVYIESRHNVLPISLLWSGQSHIDLPDGSQLIFERKIGQGLAIERLGIDKLRIASREGGERFRPDANRPTRTLKHLLQEANIPPWERMKLPLIYLQDELAVVPGIGIAVGLEAIGQEAGLLIVWRK
ncbi:MAG: tRNA lysidine(34) synthetase TilS [Methylophilaceae bacterium]|nr:tRNA lysidine(34) synthetase TilS [Methylophilaceae bacterium]